MFGYSNEDIITEKKDNAKDYAYNIDKYAARFFEHAIKYRYNKSVQSSSWVTTICDMSNTIKETYIPKNISAKQYKAYSKGIEVIYREGYTNCKNTKGNEIVPAQTDLLQTFPTIEDIADTNKVYDFLRNNLAPNSEAAIELKHRGII